MNGKAPTIGLGWVAMVHPDDVVEVAVLAGGGVMDVCTLPKRSARVLAWLLDIVSCLSETLRYGPRGNWSD